MQKVPILELANDWVIAEYPMQNFSGPASAPFFSLIYGFAVVSYWKTKHLKKTASE